MELLLLLKINILKMLSCFTKKKDYEDLDKEIDLNIINQYENL